MQNKFPSLSALKTFLESKGFEIIEFTGYDLVTEHGTWTMVHGVASLE